MPSARKPSGRRLIGWLVIVGSLIVYAAAGLGAWTWWWWQGMDEAIEAGERYSTEQLFESYFLYDLGVADMNRDGRLDLFTTNHSAAQELRLNEGDGRFSASAASALGLDHTPAYPGLHARFDLPPVTGAGFYVDLWRSAIVLRTAGSAPLAGVIAFPWPASVVARGAMAVERQDADAPGTTRARFLANGDGELLIEAHPAPTDGFAIEIELDEALPLDQVFVGPERIVPNSHSFTLTPRDRHGMAWADLDGDGTSHVFVSLGGLRGRIPYDVPDELLRVAAADPHADTATERGLEKAGCPGRRAAWVDIDGNGRLDLYQVCGRGGDEVDRAAVPNRLYLQGPDGRFTEAAADYGLDIDSFGTFIFFDVDDDGLPDLFWAGSDRYTLYRNQGGHFLAEDLGQTPGSGSRLRQVTIGDVNRNGSLDLFVASRSGNTLFLNDGGSLRAVAPATLGLPEAAHTASWVDTDNNGRLDLAAVPGGIFRQAEDGSFVATGDLQARWPVFVSDARAAWLDVDGNGMLEAVIAARPCWPGRLCAAKERALALARRGLQEWLGLAPPDVLYDRQRWLVTLHRRQPAGHHWLGVDIVGLAGNRQSIGARVTLVTAAGRVASEVGQFDAAHQGQGNYRLHFGLGEQPAIERLDVRWPDGAELTVEAPETDRLIEIRHPALAAG
jgi:hypothetical protein